MTDIVIAGGGIGGLGAALMLARSGLSVRVLERAPEFAEVGAGLQLAPNATRELARYGVLDDVLRTAVRPRRLVALSAVTGEELTHLDLEDAERRYGGPYIVLHRSDLLEALRVACEREDGVTLLPGHEVVRFESRTDDVVVGCGNGAEFTAKLLLGADGLHSRVRAAIVQDEPVNSGYVAYRGAVPIEDVDKRLALDDVAVYFGPGLHLVQYPVRSGQLYNQVAVFRSQEYLDGKAEWGSPEELDRTYGPMCEAVQVAIPSLHRNRCWPMFDRDPITTWTSGRAALLGDAAHPMLQYLAQGAVQALIDGATLARTLPRLGTGAWPQARLDEALRSYQDVRVPMATSVQTTARTWGEMWHVDGLASSLRDEAFRLRRPEDYRHIDWLYGVRPDEPATAEPPTSVAATA